MTQDYSRKYSRVSLRILAKEDQKAAVIAYILEKGYIPKDLASDEVEWFYENLGIDDIYFLQESIPAIAGHIMLLYTAKIDAQVQGTRNLIIDLKQEWEDKAVYIHSTEAGVVGMMHKADHIIDDKYLDHPVNGKLYQVESYLSTGSATHNMKTKLRCFFVNKCEFANPNPNEEQARDIDQVADPSLFERISVEDKERIQKIMIKALDQMGAVVEIIENPKDNTKTLTIAYRARSTEKFLSAITDLYHYHGYYATRKFLDNFSNGISLMTVYLSPIPNTKVDKDAMSMIQKEVSMLFAVPNSPFQDLFRNRTLDVQEIMYATSAFVFVQHFLNRLGQEYWTIKGFFAEDNPHHQQLLGRLKKRLRGETFTVDLIKDVVIKYPLLLKILYANFAEKAYIKRNRMSMFAASLNQKRMSLIMDKKEILQKIDKTVSGETEKSIFEGFLSFNENVVKTNFYNPTKVAFSYRFKCDFLPKTEYPMQPYGIFLVVGNEFRGFHVRFQDIARGGIRIVRSRNKEIYELNRRYLFDENYALASTQTRKNKDIPEGGSKGTILLNPECQGSSRVAFEKYIDALLDLLVPEKTNSKMQPKNAPAPEILFFGPDEGTADFMDWASEAARKRGLKYWRAITTGKSQQRGGIPHDTYGMTTRSVNRYVQGIYRKLGLDETKITKFQTGGPDGDLGSNEIKMSKDLTIGIVDGSGVLYDPVGINRKELLRLANERKMIADFNKALLSPKGFKVLVDENQVTLPDGTVVASGVEFRNTFHLNPLSSADIFVPCGGRPEAVDISNYQELLTADGTPRFKYIVEGANLFITQEARIRLEKAGCILFKDASANKGGVTSSSLEVLAALSLTDEEFEKTMAVKNGVIPAFYRDYVKAVQDIIKTNADLEFECIWREAAKYPEKTKAELSDQLSLSILELKNQLKEDDSLWENEDLRAYVLSLAMPTLLQDKVGGIEVLAKRLPQNYQMAVFGSYLASRFIYSYGIEPSQMAFFDFMTEYMDIGLQEEEKVEEKLEELDLEDQEDHE